MPSSILNHKFIIDENVHHELRSLLQKSGQDVTLAPKSASDSRLAAISKKEKRILITNDQDFFNYSKDELFSFVWLKIKQGDDKSLLRSFEKLLKEFKRFQGRSVILENDKWKDFPLIQKSRH